MLPFLAWPGQQSGACRGLGLAQQWVVGPTGVRILKAGVDDMDVALSFSGASGVIGDGF